MIRLVESILRTALRIYLNLSSQPKGGLTGQWVSWFFHILLMVSGCFSKEVLKTRSNLTRGFWWLQSGLDRVRWSFKWLQSGQEEEEARGGGKYLGWFVGQPDQQTWTGLSTFEQQTVGIVLIWLKPDPYREFRGKGKNTIDRIKLRHTGWVTCGTLCGILCRTGRVAVTPLWVTPLDVCGTGMPLAHPQRDLMIMKCFFALFVLLSMEHVHLEQKQVIVFIFDKRINLLEIWFI